MIDKLIADVVKTAITAPIDIVSGVARGVEDAADDIMDRIDGTK